MLPQKVSLVVSTEDNTDNRNVSWDSLLGNAVSDFKPLKSQNHRGQILILLSILALTASLLFKWMTYVFRAILLYAFKT